MKKIILPALLVLATFPAIAEDTVKVTPDNFKRAESDMYFGNNIKDAGGIGKIGHRREVASIDKQSVIRMNRDTLYSFGVFDLDAGPITITIPDAGSRFMSLAPISEDHYIMDDVAYAAGSHTYTKEQAGTRYMLVAVRTLVDPNDPADLDKVHALQDAIKTEQPGGPGVFEVPNWDKESQDKVRNILLELAETTTEMAPNAFGKKGEVNPVDHLIATAAGWGGNPQKDAFYIFGMAEKNDGETIYKLTVKKDVPVDGFWSVTVYNKDGYFEKNKYDAYSLNNITAKKDSDGSVTIQFGGCDGKIPNCLPIMKGWNYAVRLYRPHEEIINGQWKFPDAEEAGKAS